MKNYLNYTIREVGGRQKVFDENGKLAKDYVPDGADKFYFTVWGVLAFESKLPYLHVVVSDGQILLDKAKTAVEFKENGLIGWKTPAGDLLLPPIFDQIEICEKFIYAHYGPAIKIYADHSKYTSDFLERGRFYQNGKMGIKNPDGTILFPAIYDEIYGWLCNSDVYYTRIGNEFHYYNSKREEILTTYRKFDGVDDELNPYDTYWSPYRETLLTMQITNDLSDSQSCIHYGEKVRLDRILKSEAIDIFKNNCEVWDKGIERLDCFCKSTEYVAAAYYAQSKSDTPIIDCLKQFARLKCYDDMDDEYRRFIIKIWTNRNTKISISQMNKLVYHYQDMIDCSSKALPMDYVTIGYDDSLEDGMVKMFQVITAPTYHIREEQFDKIYNDALSGTVDNYKEKKQLLLDTLEEFRQKKNWTDEEYKSYYNEYFSNNGIYGDYKGFVWEEKKKLLEYLIDEEDYSVEKTAFSVCWCLAWDAKRERFNEADIRNAYKKIEWAIHPDRKSNLLAVSGAASGLNHIREAIDSIKESDSEDKDSLISALKDIEQLLLDNGALTAKEITALNINPLNNYYLKNDADKPIAEHIDKCKIIYEAWEMQCCGDPIKVGERITLECAKRKIDEAEYLHQHHFYEGFMYNLCGKVESIVVKYSKPKETDVEKPPREVSFIDGWTEGKDACKYIITLSDVSVVEQGYTLWPAKAEIEHRREIAESLRGTKNAE